MVVVIALVALVAAAVTVCYLRVREPNPPASVPGPAPDPLPKELADRGGAGLAVPVADPGLREVGARWYLNWSYRPHPDVDLEFVPLVGGYPGNKPVRDDHLGDERTLTEYARDFRRCHQLLKSLNPTFQVSVGPAILSQDKRITKDQVGARDGIDYLTKMIASYREQFGEPIPTEYFAATGHVVTGGAEGAGEFQRGLLRLRHAIAEADLRDRRVVLTEFGVPLRGSSPEEIAGFMRAAIPHAATATDDTIGCTLDDNRLVQQWAWFTARPLPLLDKLRVTGFGGLVAQLAQTSLFNLKGEPTYLAEIYATLMRRSFQSRLK